MFDPDKIFVEYDSGDVMQKYKVAEIDVWK